MNQKRTVLVLGLFLIISNFSYSQATFAGNPTDAAMLSVLDGDGVGLSNATLENGDRSSQLATFSNGTAGANLSLDGGVLMSTGSATQAFGSNGNAAWPSNSGVQASIDALPLAPGGVYSDPDITAIDATAVHDVVVFSFDVVLEPGFTDLKVVYQFGSDEYPDYVGSVFNDIFGFFVSGPGITGTQNIALVPGTTSPVAVNTINAGFVGCNDDATTEDLTNSAFYINNGHDTSAAACNTNPGPFTIFTEYNGITQQLTGVLSGLLPGNTYRFKMAIADTGDPTLDSGVFISTISGDRDSDGDGLSDARDPDDDDDGILDIDESGAAGEPNLDVDGDGIPAYLDDNDNNFTIGNVNGVVEPQFDFDGDGISNHLDLDSDNDGILDVIEAGGTDPDNDGVIGTGVPTDADGDGLADIVDNIDSGSGVGEVTTGTPLPTPNSDGSGNDDYLDIDADNDGIVDNIEAQTTAGYQAPLLNDADGDGIDDRYDINSGGFPLIPINTDAGTPNSDTVPDYLDLDSDGDNESDTIEAYDTNDDGIADTVPAASDADNDGLDDNFDVDDANLDPTNGGQTATSPFPDTDSPGGESNWREWIDISLLKTDTYVDTNTNGVIDAGDTITYVFTITNTGGTTLTNVTVTDSGITVSGTPIASLASGAMDNTTFTGTYTLLQADINTGSYSNSATVSSVDVNVNLETDVSDDPDNATNVDPDGDNDPDDPTVTDLRQPLLDITKTSTGVVDTNANGIIDAGDTINYTFIVTNTGNIDLTGISVTDANATVVPATTIDLVVGAVDNSTYTASYIITAGDITAGNFTNTAVASAPNPLGGAAVTDNSDDPNNPTNVDPNNDGSPDDPTVTDLRQPLLDITKTSTGVVDTNGNGIIDAGDTINYTFVVTNTGNIDLTGIGVTDANATVVPATTIDLIVGAVDNSTYTASYIITAGDITAGTFNNQAVASALNPLNPLGPPVTDNSDDPTDATNVDPNNDGSPDDVTTTDLRQPLLDITKTSTGVVDTNGNGIIDAGDTINYTFVVTNTGNIDLTGISVTDANATVVPATTIDLVVGAVDNSTYTASYIITAGDITAGNFTNTAVASAPNPLGGAAVTDNSDDPNNPTNVDPNNDGSPDDPTVTDLRQPLLNITKTSTGVVDTNGNGIIDAGDTINYTFVVTNTGNIDLTGISVTDANATVVPATTIDLIVGAVDNSTYTASYIITAGDITAGTFNNQAVVSALNPLNPLGPPVTDNSDDPTDATNVDPNNDGSPDDVTTTDLRQPLLDITKTSTGVVDTNGNGIIDAGDTINYTFVVTNTGNIDLTGISVTDANATVTPATTIDLVVGAVDNSTYTASYIITAGDITAGNFTNTAVASAPNPLGGAAVTDNSDDPNDATDIDPNNDGSPDDPTVTDLRQPLLDITKTSTGVVDTNGNGIIDAGDTINYTFVVTNTGNIDLTGIGVTDANATVTPATTIDLVAGAVDNSTYTASYIITAGDITAGTFNNQAVASALNPLNPLGPPVTDNSDDPTDATNVDPNNDGSPDDVTTTDLRQPLLDITKTSTGVVDTNGNGIIDAGDTINYTFVVTNTGNIDLTGISVTDANATVTPATTIDLVVGAVDNSTYTASYIITAGDITAGNFSNTAVASAPNPLGGAAVTDNSDDPNNATNVDPNNDGSPDDPTVTDLRQPLLDITKTSTGVVDTNANGIIDAGDTINYTFVVTNTGNIDLTGISVTDANATVVPATTIDLVAGAVDNSTYTASYIITAGDITAGNFSNTAVASAPNPLGGAAVTDNSDDPNDATDIDPNNDGSPDDPTVTDLRQPLLDITKTSTGVVDTNGNGIIDAGDTINYTFVVTNTGNIDLTGISVTDANATVVPATTIDLVVGAVDNSTYTASYIITAGDITAGNFSNTAVASAPNPLGGAAVTDNSDDPNDATDIDPNNDGSPDDPTVTDLRQPLLDITKTSTGVVDTNGNGIIDAGDTINYTFVVTNTGNIDLTGIGVTDANATVVPATTIDLIVGAVDNSTYTASYIITAGDITAGTFNNQAVASALNPLNPLGPPVTDNSDDPTDATNVDPNNDGSPDDVTTTDLRQPLLDITKTSTGVVDTNANGIIDAGDTINYTFVVTNTGNIDLTGISVTDANATVVPATTIDLVVGAVDNSTYTASYIITAGDITAGNFTNTAVASAPNPLGGAAVTDNSDDPNDATNVDPNNDGSPDDPTVTDLRQPLLDITKTSTGVVDTNGNGIIDAGDTINYTFVVTNTGNIDLTGIGVTDANATVVPATTIDLIVGAVDNSTYTASYIITAGDITAGTFNNQAVASALNPLNPLGPPVTDNSDDPTDATNVDPNNDGSPDDVTTTDLRQPLLDITKTSTGVVDTNGNGIIDAGDTINYTFVVTNTGNIDLTGISVTDANATVTPATTIDLVVGAVDNSTYTASYIITAGDITAGNFSNTAVASAPNPLGGAAVTDNSDDPNNATNVDPNNDGSPDDPTVTDLRQPLLDITKTSTGVVDTNGNGIIDAGDTINYTFVVTNTGNIDLTGIGVTDANATVVPATTIDLVVGAVDNSTYTASYIITAGDITAGTFNNQAVASALNPLNPLGPPVTDNSDDPTDATNVDPNNDGSPDDVTTTDLRQPLLDITKTSTGVVDTNGNGIIDAGDTINYTFVVTNTGNIDLTGISVTDANATVVPATTIDLVVGAVDNSTYTASYIITAGDITAGNFTNTAVASAPNPLGGAAVTDNSDDPNDATDIDPNNDGSPDDPTVTDLRQPLLDITKTSTGVVDTNGNGIIDAGDTINYTFVVTNTGNIDLTGIGVTDANATVVPATTIDLIVGAVDNSTYTASYIITAGDITAGTFNNQAVASALNPLNPLGPPVTDNSDDPTDATNVDPNNDGSPDDVTTTDLRQPLLDITKTSTGVVDTNANGIIDAGDTINYTFVVTNTGNIDLTGISVTDANATVVPATTIDLVVGAVDNSTYTASYIITAGDITAGNFTNTAVASAPNPLGGAAVTDNSDDPNDATNVDPNNDGSPDDPTVTDLRQPLLDITKTSTGVVDTNGNGIIDAGDTINYTFVVTNTGNIDLTGIGVTDANATVVPATTIDLIVGAVDNSTYTASYIITAGDITAGTFNNQAVASALNPLNPLGPPVTDNSDDPTDATNVDPNNDGSPDDVTTTDLRQPLLDITKTSTGVVDTNGNGIIDAGDTINYTFVVTNTGNIDLTGISVTDANATVTPATTIDLVVGAVDNSTYTASYIITAGDITAGNFSNTAVASAPNPLGGAAVTDNSDDPNNATNVDPNNDGSPDDPTVTDLRQPLLDITKTSTGVVDTNGNGIIDAGDTINYTFVVTNTGNIDLTGIGVTDANATVVPATTIDLVVGAVDNSTYTASYIITAGDITAGTFNNQAVASALNPLNPLGPPVTDNSDDPTDATNVDPNNDGSPDDVTTTDLRQPLLDITKTSTGVVDTNGNGIIDAGDTINYTFVVTNTGNIDLTGISVTDANATVVPATTIDLVVGAVDNSTYTASYIITAGDITAGNFTNTAVASAPNPLGGAAVTDNSDDPNNPTNVDPNNDGSPDDPTVTDLRQPLLDITKTSTGVVDTNGNGIIDAGDTINYTFVVTNTGNIDLTGIGVTDANATVVPATTIDLVVGAVDNSTYTASYIITAGDITAGTFNNQAVASALNPLNPLGPPVTDNSDDPTDATNVDPNNDGSPDDPTDYRFTSAFIRYYQRPVRVLLIQMVMVLLMPEIRSTTLL
ncbi:choice-of-anchor L domain-containing protein [Aquimarina spinulae]|uniref:DUF7507 domain-containing protein n=1 Tax=Aquimarina spinulae TaxID=1192023 RepID=UPI0020C35D5F|nr:choice-of-anchor L domain-containing protein [Aquimarina spinulae]